MYPSIRVPNQVSPSPATRFFAYVNEMKASSVTNRLCQARTRPKAKSTAKMAKRWAPAHRSKDSNRGISRPRPLPSDSRGGLVPAVAFFFRTGCRLALRDIRLSLTRSTDRRSEKHYTLASTGAATVPVTSAGPTSFRRRWGGSCTAAPDLPAFLGMALQLPPQRHAPAAPPPRSALRALLRATPYASGNLLPDAENNH